MQDTNTKTKLIGLCGRAGSGKSTISEFIAPTKSPVLVHYTNPWAYILSNLFGWSYETLDSFIVGRNLHDLQHSCFTSNLPPDPVFDKIVPEAFEWTYQALAKFDPMIIEHMVTEFDAPPPIDPVVQDWVQLSFADPLKRICVPLCGLPYPTLLGVDSSCRAQRELPIRDIIPNYWHPTLSGRQLLEQIGTNVFRAVDDQIWIKLAQRQICDYNTRGFGVVISDVRFRNEADMIRLAGGVIWVLSRYDSDLTLTLDDQQTHVSKWEFLTFISDRDVLINNHGSLAELYDTVQKLL